MLFLYCAHCMGVADYDWLEYDNPRAYKCQSCGRKLDTSKREVLVGPSSGKARYVRGDVEIEITQDHHAEMIERGWSAVELRPLEL